MNSLKTYYHLAKPGIIYGNLLSAFAGFFFAVKNISHLTTLFFLIIGMSLVIASGCVYNNVIDKDVDKKMERTSKRAVATGEISILRAIAYASTLGILGFTLLRVGTNILTTILGAIGFIVYVFFYGYAKRHTIYNTLIGSISGAMPLVAGYTSVANKVDAPAIILFCIMAFWQMPHFYAIAIRRLTDYTKAGLLIWPVKQGVQNTKVQILIYTIGFVFATSLLFLFRYKGYIYITLALLSGIYWLWVAVQGFRAKDDTLWAKKMFFTSLFILLLTMALIATPKI